MKFGRKENKISSSKIMQKMAERLVPDLFLFFEKLCMC